jgi:hypothetical protein
LSIDNVFKVISSFKKAYVCRRLECGVLITVAKLRREAKNRQVIHIFLPHLLRQVRGSRHVTGWIMTEVLNVPAKVVDFREEARGCVQLAKTEKHEAVRTVLLGMALGYLRLSDRAKSADAIKLHPEDVCPLHG